MRAVSAGSNAPRSTDSRRYAASRRSPYHSCQGPGCGVLSIGAEPWNPGQGAPNAAAPARCKPASARPNSSAAAADGCPCSIHAMPSRSGVSTSTSGTATVPVSASQRRPLASAAKKPAGACPPASGHDLVKTDSPSSKVSRLVWQIEPPSTGVSRIR